MLKAMRKNVKSLAPTLWIVIATFIISIFAIWGGAGRLGEKAGTRTIAYVGKDKISMDTYYLTLRQRLEAIQKQFQGLNKTLVQQLNIPQQVLEQLIQQDLLEQKAQDMGLTVSEQEVRDRIVSMFQREGKFVGFEEYKRILDWNHMSVAQFEDDIKKDIILNKMVQFITAGIAVTPEEVWQNYVKQNDSAKIELLILDESKIPSDQPLSTEEIQAYFDKNKDRYSLPERREGVYAFVSTDETKKEVKVSDPDIEKYYRDNIDQFKEPEKVKVSRIYLPFAGKDKSAVEKEAQALEDRLSGGADFAQLARSYSQDEKAKEGGDWGFDEWRSLSPAEREEIGKLASGQVSGVIEGPEGLSILKVAEKEPEKTTPLEEAKERIKTILEDQKARDLAEQRMIQLEKSARKEKSLDVAAQKMGLKVKPTGLLKQGQALGEIDPAGSFSQALFGLKDRDISAPVYLFSGAGVVQLEKIEAPRPATLEEVKDTVEKDLRAAEKKEIARQRILEARAQVKGKKWDEVAAKLGLEYKNAMDFRLEQYLPVIGESLEIDRLAFSLPLDEISEPVEYSGGYALVQVLGRKEASREEFEKNKATETNNLLEAKKNKFLQAYLDRLRQEKNVRVNYNLFTQVNNDILSRYESQE
jgi:peptidyl-prolyl cis-trans isomerase D